MAWPSAVTALQPALASDYNGLLDAVQTWGGNVSADGNSVLDLLGVGLHTSNASWQEFRLQAVAGANVAADALALQVNTRSTGGGADAFANVFTITSLTGAVTVASALTLGAGLNLNAQTISGAGTFSGALTFNGALTLGAGLNLNGQTVSGAGTFSGALTLGAAVTFSAPDAIAFGSGWQSWTPTVTAGGSMTISGLALVDAQYLRVGPLIFFKIYFNCTLGGTASSDVAVFLPVAVSGALTQVTAGGSLNAIYYPPVMAFALASSLTFRAAATWPLGLTYFAASGFYRCA